MPSLGTLKTGNPISTTHAWAGGQGLMSCTGDMIETGRPCAMILESDETGSFEPAGDAILHTSPEKLTFFLPPCNLRIRCNTPDAITSCEVFIEP